MENPHPRPLSHSGRGEMESPHPRPLSHSGRGEMESPHPRPLSHSGRGGTDSHDPLRPHSHDPNPAPPSASPDFILTLPDGSSQTVTPDDLRRLPQTTITDCFIVSTGHGTSGPFTFTGVTLADFVRHYWNGEWQQVEVISADGFGTRLCAEEVIAPSDRPILLATASDGQPLTRAAGLVRLIVPSETDDALRQVKWVGEIRIL